MRDNLNFLLRSATIDKPFSYVSDVWVGNSYPYEPDTTDHPEVWYVRVAGSTDYEYAGYHFFSPALNYSVIQDLRPVHENYLWRNFVFNTADLDGLTFNTGAGQYFPNFGSNYWEEYRTLDAPTYQYAGSGTETPIPLTFSNATAQWLYFPFTSFLTNDSFAMADLGLYLDGNGNTDLANNAFNLYGLRLNSAHFASIPNYVTILPGGAGARFDNWLFMEAAVPQLSTVGYYFASQTPYFNYPGAGAPPLPGSPTFSITNPSPLLITGFGQPMTISGWAKQSILNGYPNKFGYLEQYFDRAYILGTNGLPTTNDAGLLSPYGEFFPTNTGAAAALVTMPDIETGQRGTGIVHVISLNVDANHDGTIDRSFNGPDTTSRAQPFIFWINNDFEPVAEDLFRPGLHDYDDGKITSFRDLEDFARLWISGMPVLSSAQGYNVTLSWRNVNRTPKIKIYPAAEANGGIGYLTNGFVAFDQMVLSGSGPSPGQTLGEVAPGQSLTFPTDYFTQSGRKHFLFEGSGAGSGELVLTVLKGTSKLTETSTWFDLRDVGDFYEQAYATNVTSGNPPSSLVSNFGVIQTAKSRAPDETKQMIVFVHGINNTVSDYETTTRTIFKRLYWAGYHGRFASFRWPCAYLPWNTPNPFLYNLGEFYAFKSATAFKNYLSYLRNNRPDLTDYAINLYAHSQGNVVTSEAILQGAPFDNYILTQGAFPTHCYDTNAPFLQKLLDAETNSVNAVQTPFYPVNGGYHGYCSPIQGNVINFYNTNDFALASGTTAGLQTNWEENQRTQKPEAFFGGPSYVYYPSNLTTVAYYAFGNSYTVTDLQEIKALVARSRSKAVGAQSGLHGAISGETDLLGEFGFSNTRSEHSAQFNRSIQTIKPYWEEVVRTFNSPTP